MSSGAIMTLIKQKEEELNKLNTTNNEVTITHNAVDCMSQKFRKAGELINAAGTVGGKSFDSGATEATGEQIKKISAKTQGLLSEIEKKIATLKAEIADLYVAYQEALAAEEAALAAEEAAKKMKNEVNHPWV